MTGLQRACAAILLVGLPAASAAQSSISARATRVPLPSIGLPLPRIGLPLPAMTVSLAREPQSPRRQGHGDSRKAFHSVPMFVYVPTVVYVVPVYGDRLDKASSSEPKIDVEPEPQPAQREVEPAPPAPQTAVATAPSTTYVIPGCYVGNVEPTQLSVPATCDLHRLVIYRP